jgi:hypothetical protein
MTYGEAVEEMNKGNGVKLPEWSGHWFKEDGIVKVSLSDGGVLKTPSFQQYIFRTDWEIA